MATHPARRRTAAVARVGSDWIVLAKLDQSTNLTQTQTHDRVSNCSGTWSGFGHNERRGPRSNLQTAGYYHVSWLHTLAFHGRISSGEPALSASACAALSFDPNTDTAPKARVPAPVNNAFLDQMTVRYEWHDKETFSFSGASTGVEDMDGVDHYSVLAARRSAHHSLP